MLRYLTSAVGVPQVISHFHQPSRSPSPSFLLEEANQNIRLRE